VSASTPVEPHHDQLTPQDQAQIWEAAMADDDGVPTYRLVPLGWDPQLATDAIAPVGIDADVDLGRPPTR
jgi:hypothetical protein